MFGPVADFLRYAEMDPYQNSKLLECKRLVSVAMTCIFQYHISFIKLLKPSDNPKSCRVNQLCTVPHISVIYECMFAMVPLKLDVSVNNVN